MGLDKNCGGKKNRKSGDRSKKYSNGGSIYVNDIHGNLPKKEMSILHSQNWCKFKQL